MNLINMISDYFSYSFVWYAFIAGILAALCSSLLGVTLVLKRYSFIGDGLSHVAFGAMAVAAVLSVSNNLLIVMPVTIISAILLLKTGQNAKIKGDARARNDFRRLHGLRLSFAESFFRICQYFG